MHQDLGYLFAAFAITWIGLFGYLFFIQRRLAEMGHRLDWLEKDTAGKRSGDSGSP